MFNATDLLNPSASKVFFWLRFSPTIDNTSVTRQDSMPNPSPQPDRSAARRFGDAEISAICQIRNFQARDKQEISRRSREKTLILAVRR
jgi:hypothetical protein